MSIQQRYNGVFDDITISDEKRKEIEVAMRENSTIKKRISIKKYAVIAVSLVMILSMGIIVNAATDGELFSKLANIVGIRYDGKDVSREEFDEYLDDEGNLDEEKLPEAMGNGGLIYTYYDEEGNVISYSMIPGDNPTNSCGWYWDGEEVGKRYLRISEKAELLCELKFETIDGKRFADMNGDIESLPRTIPFSYEGENYTMVLIGEYDPIPRTQVYKGIVEYNVDEDYSEYEAVYPE